jgi:hypothetical protein
MSDKHVIEFEIEVDGRSDAELVESAFSDMIDAWKHVRDVDSSVETAETKTSSNDSLDCPYCGKTYEIEEYYRQHVRDCFG